MSQVEFSDETRAAVELARHAGLEILLPAMPLGKHGQGEEYKGIRELVTEKDREVERFLVEELRSEFDHAILAEEEVDEEGDTRWIIDPLDGTTNFVHGLPFYAISIALERAGSCVLGVVYVPYLDETFLAERGKGAWFNGESIRLEVSDTSELIRAVLATGFAYDRERFPNLDRWARLHEATRGLRRCGSAAIDLAYVAAGRFDGFWEVGLAPYDVAAGAVLVEEAGGRVTDLAGGDDWLEGRSILATNGHLHQAIADALGS